MYDLENIIDDQIIENGNDHSFFLSVPLLFCLQLDVTEKLVTDLQARTQEYLQPNPATRARLMTMHTISKVRGQAHKSAYPQPEGNGKRG